MSTALLAACSSCLADAGWLVVLHVLAFLACLTVRGMVFACCLLPPPAQLEDSMLIAVAI